MKMLLIILALTLFVYLFAIFDIPELLKLWRLKMIIQFRNNVKVKFAHEQKICGTMHYIFINDSEFFTISESGNIVGHGKIN